MLPDQIPKWLALNAAESLFLAMLKPGRSHPSRNGSTRPVVMLPHGVSDGHAFALVVFLTRFRRMFASLRTFVSYCHGRTVGMPSSSDSGCPVLRFRLPVSGFAGAGSWFFALGLGFLVLGSEFLVFCSWFLLLVLFLVLGS